MKNPTKIIRSLAKADIRLTASGKVRKATSDITISIDTTPTRIIFEATNTSEPEKGTNPEPSFEITICQTPKKNHGRAIDVSQFFKLFYFDKNDKSQFYPIVNNLKTRILMAE